MLTAAQQHAIDQFAKGLLALGDDALIDTYHQAADDFGAAQAEGSDNLCKAHALALATEKVMRDQFPDYRTRYKCGTPEANSPASPFRRTRSWQRAGRRVSHRAPPGKD